MKKDKYQIVSDGNGCGVVDETDTLINDVPLRRDEAEALANEMNHPGREVYADENPLPETYESYG